jgi:NADP-dependent 3-hydroxy acid dehydrogenase YdfG
MVAGFREQLWPGSESALPGKRAQALGCVSFVTPVTTLMPQPRPSIFITGAAAGIGRATALRFAKAGWFVGASDVDATALEALRAELGQACFTTTLDVSQPEAWADALQRFWPAAGERLDVLFNNAGIAVTDPFASTGIWRLHKVVDVNLKGVMNGCHTAFAYLKQTPGARVISMCSASALHGQPLLATYSATKSAVRSLTEALDIEWRQHGIRLADLLPLFVDTAMVRNEVQRMKTVQMLGVRLSADDVAAQVWRLATMPQGRLPLHATVGWQTALFALLSKISPSAINHYVTAKLGGY